LEQFKSRAEKVLGREYSSKSARGGAFPAGK